MTEEPGYRQQLYQRYASLMDTAEGAKDASWDAKTCMAFADPFRPWFPCALTQLQRANIERLEAHDRT